MRIVCLCLLAVTCATAENINQDLLYGHWVVDKKAVTAAQKEADGAAAKVENFGITLTLRTARIIFATDEMIAGMWRVDEATPTIANLVIQPKGADAWRYHLTLDKGSLVGPRSASSWLRLAGIAFAKGDFRVACARTQLIMPATIPPGNTVVR